MAKHVHDFKKQSVAIPNIDRETGEIHGYWQMLTGTELCECGEKKSSWSLDPKANIRVAKEFFKNYPKSAWATYKDTKLL